MFCMFASSFNNRKELRYNYNVGYEREKRKGDLQYIVLCYHASGFYSFYVKWF